LFISILLPLLLTFLIVAVSSPTTTTMPKPHQGVLDLRNWDLERDGIVVLDGEWEFYWNQLLTYQDFHDDTTILPSYSVVPSIWNDHVADGKKLPGFGYATYRLKIQTNNKELRESLKIMTMSTAYKLMVNDRIVATNGTVGVNKETTVPAYKPLVTTFETASDEFEIIVQVSNFDYARGGLWSSISLGTDQQIKDFDRKKQQRDIFLLGALFIMTLYYISMFLLQKRYYYKVELYFVLIMLLTALRVLFYGEYLILNFFPTLSVQFITFIEYTTVCWALAALALFMHELYPEECSPRALRTVVVVSSLFTLINGITPLYFYTNLYLGVQGLSIIGGFYYLYVACLAIIKNRLGATLLLSAIIFTICLFVEESLSYWHLIDSKYAGTFPIVGFVFIFIQSFVLAQRSSKAFADVKALSTKLISLDKRKDDFMANTSHELRTPLHGIIAITESVLESTTDILPPQDKKNLSLVISSGRRLANLINDILDHEKLKHGDIHLNKQNIDIGQVIPAVLEISNYLSFSKAITLISNIPKDIPLITGDENRFTQIMYNLLGNAVKFTQQGTITISAAQSKDMVEISVEDTGIGMPSDKLGDIFKSFEQLDGSAAGQYGGTGLGLSITKYLVEIHGGQIWATSTLGKGSKFTFSMPLGIAEPTTGNLTNHQKRPVAYGEPLAFATPAYFPQDGEFTILLVDDDYVNLHALVNIMAAEKYSAIAVTSGKEAFAVLAEHKNIDLVILDIMLPVMSGYEICQKLRQEHSLFELPVLMMTASNSANSMLTGFAAGANDFLSKPFDSSELKARMNTLLQLKKSVNHAMQAEMAFLLAQIKPHFLYNALNTIMSFCWTDGEKAGQLLLSLSEYLRGSFNFNNMNQFISLEKELEFVESYITIEKARFEEKLNCQFDINVPLNCMIPTLIIQPIVENAIKHGILSKKEGGSLVISALKQDSHLLIEIADDGVGIPQDKLATMLADSPTKSVGLRNINKRLRQLYGYGLDITSEMGIGTKVRIKIPCARKEE